MKTLVLQICSLCSNTRNIYDSGTYCIRTVSRNYSLKDNSLPLVAHDEILDIMQYTSNGQRIKISYLYGEYLLPFNSIMRHKP